MATKKNEAQVKFKADIADFTQGIKDMNSDIQTLNAKLKLNATQLKANADDTDLLTDRQRLLNEKLEASQAKVTAATAAYEAAKEIFGENSEAAELWERKLLAAQTQEEQIKQSIADVTKQLEDSTSATGANSDALDDNASATKEADDAEKDFITTARATMESLDNLGSTLSSASDKLIDFGQAALEARDKYDDAMDTIQYATGYTNEGMEELNGLFDRIVQTIPVDDMDDLAVAIGDVATRTDLSTDEIEIFITEVAELSKMSGESASSITEDAISIANTYGITFNEALDVMHRAGQSFGLTFDEIGAGAEGAGLVLHDQLGLSVEQVTGLMGLMNRSGLDANDAISGLVKAAQSMSADGTVSIEAMNDVLAGLADGTIDVSDAQDIFGKKAGQFISFLQDSGITSVEDLTEAYENFTSEGMSVAEMYDEMYDAGDDAAVMQQNIDLAMASLGETLITSLGPAISGIIELVQGAIEWWTGLDDTTKGIIITIVEMIAIIGTVMGVLTSLSQAVVAFNILLGANPIALIIMGVMALIAALVALWTNCEGFRNAVMNIINTIVGWVQTAWNSITGFFTNAWNTISGVWGNVTSWFQGVWDGIAEPVQGIWDGIKSTFEGAINTIKGFLNFEWRWPSIPLPHFSISGSINPLDWFSQGLPSVSVEWYAKAMNNPYIFNQPTLVGVGEAGSEMIAGVDFVRNQVEDALNSNAISTDPRLIRAIEDLATRPAVLQVGDYEMAAATANADDRLSATRTTLNGRGLALQ